MSNVEVFLRETENVWRSRWRSCEAVCMGGWRVCAFVLLCFLPWHTPARYSDERPSLDPPCTVSAIIILGVGMARTPHGIGNWLPGNMTQT